MNILKELLHKLGQKEQNVGKNVDNGQILEMIFQSDLQNLQDTKEQLDVAAFDLAVDMIDEAKTIYIVGIRNCQPLAEFLGFYLDMIYDHVKLLHTNSTSEIFEQMLRIGSEDVLIGISFPRYSMRTLKAMEYANQRNAKVIAVTDSIHSPMNLYSACNLVAKSGMASVIDSLTAPLSVVNALIAALAMKHQKELALYLKELDEVWEEYQIYNEDEINSVDDHIEIWQAKKEKAKEEK